MQHNEEEKTSTEYFPYKLGAFCKHRSDKSASPFVDVICNRKQNVYHRVSQAGKICNKCASIISKSASISHECLCCQDSLENYLEDLWICQHRDAIYDEIAIKCLQAPSEVHEIPFKTKVCKQCYDKIRAAFMFASDCAVCNQKQNEMFENIQRTMTLPAHYFFDQIIKVIVSTKMPEEEARQQIECYCLAEPHNKINSKFQKIAEQIGKNQASFHLSKRYQLYPKCVKHRNSPISLCNNCLVALLNVESCPYGCPYQKQKKSIKPTSKIYEGGFVSMYPKEGKDQPYLQYFIFRQIQEANKFDRWEGRIKKIKLSEKCVVKNIRDKFSLYASVAQINANLFLFTGGAIGPNIEQLKTTNDSFLVNFKEDRKQFQIQDVKKMNHQRSSHASLHFNDSVFVFGGFCKEQMKCISSCQKFNIKSGKWDQISPMKIQRSKATVFLHKGSIYVMGGMSPNPQYSQNIMEKYDIQKNEWESVAYDGFDFPTVNGATVLNSYEGREFQNMMLLGGSDFNHMTYMVQTLQINSKNKSFEMNPSRTSQRLEYSRLNPAVCLMDTDSKNEKIALVFSGLQEHEPILSVDGLRVRFQKTQSGEQISPFFVYDNIQLGSYRLLLRENAISTYQYMLNRLLEQKIMSKQKLDKNSENIFRSQFNIHMIEKMWYGVGKCMIPLNG